MRKMIGLLAALFMFSCIGLAEPAAEPLTADDFLFVFEDTEYALGTDITPLLQAVSQKYEYTPDVLMADSCMFSGKDKEYSNDDLIFGTYPVLENGGDALETVIVFSEDYKTKRGACVGMALDAIAELYGDDFTMDYDQMIYSERETGPQLIFTLELESDTAVSWMLIKNTAN